MARQMPSKAELLDSVRHVVYEYANLISAGHLLQEVRTPLLPPVNTHVQNAFLLSCRTMADFFIIRRPTKHYIAASDFTASPEKYTLSVWKGWATALNKQLAHLAWDREQGWDGTAIKPLMEEQQAVWRNFLGNLKCEFQDRFREEINKKKQCSGFEHLDLG
jgi:hypothetical protein